MKRNVLEYAQNTYRENQIRTASREQLLLITYDIGITACKTAEAAMEKNEVEARNVALQRAQRVLRELMVSLNPERDKELAENLTNLYEFLFHQLVQANVSNDVKAVENVRDILTELRSTWADAMEKLAEQAENLTSFDSAHMDDAVVGAPSEKSEETSEEKVPLSAYQRPGKPGVPSGGFTVAG